MTAALGVSRAPECFWDDEDTLAGAALDGYVFVVPDGDGWPGVLYVDASLRQLLDMAGERPPAPQTVAAVRVAVGQIVEAHPVPEIHQDLPTRVDARGRPTGHVRVAVIHQDDAVLLTTILARNPEPVRPQTMRVGATPVWVGR